MNPVPATSAPNSPDNPGPALPARLPALQAGATATLLDTRRANDLIRTARAILRFECLPPLTLHRAEGNLRLGLAPAATATPAQF